MAGQPNRLEDGGRIDRTKRVSFRFDGRILTGFEGDTLASALLANGVSLVGRSFKYHRPRGVFSAGPEEPNALVRLRAGARAEPNTRATMVPLYDGLEAESQNRWPSLAVDLQAATQFAARFLPAGFYYKTFMGPAKSTRIWMWFEKRIRKSAGMGTGTHAADPDRYEKRSAHCAVLVVGGGPAGLAAARAAARSGKRVILVDEREGFGGRLNFERTEIDGVDGAAWADSVQAELAAMETVRLLPRTTAFGYYDDNMIACVERVADHRIEPAPHEPRQRLWTIRADEVVLACGAIEQPLVFAGNDRPGCMLAGAVRAYINGYGVLPGRSVAVATNNDDAYRTALDIVAAGGDVAAIVDAREAGAGALGEAARAAGIRVMAGMAPVAVRGRGRVKALIAAEIDAEGGHAGREHRIDCDLIAMSGGWQPVVHLASQTGAKPVWDAGASMFKPGPARQRERSAGAAAGRLDLADCLADGHAAGLAAAEAAGAPPADPTAAPTAGSVAEAPLRPLWECPDPKGGHAKKFVDHQDDVSSEDVRLAHREGYISVEHLKRYTTLGMGTDQGKTSNVPGLAIMAAARGVEIDAVGTTTFRPPYTPVAIGVLAGPEVGPHYMPLRRTPMDGWHAERGCEWIDAGLWRRPRYYPKSGESLFAAYVRETRQTRGGVGLCDVTTLGKIDLQGPDVAEFLNRVYINGWKTLPVGKARYGAMLREDGIVFDDGTTSRLGEQHYVMTTTTANVVRVMAWLEYYLQVHWPDLRVKATSVTEQWAAMAVAGPKSRDLLAKLVDRDLSNEAFPFMACGACALDAGTEREIRGRLFRISFSGELAYELNVPSDHGRAAWERLMEAGEEFGVVPYGMEALGNMRIEKGHVAGPELDGRTTAADLGLGRMMSSKKDFIGAQLARRPELERESRQRFVGLVPADGRTKLLQGAQIVAADAPAVGTSLAAGGTPVAMLGHVTSTGYSPELETPIALGLVRGGMDRAGETLSMRFPLRGITVPVKVVDPCFIDPKGERLHG